MLSIGPNRSYICGDYRIDVLRRRLFLNDEPLTVTARAFDVLVELVENAGKVVTKDELLNSVWGDTIVEENNLTQQISALRKLFNERAGDHKYIVTVPGRGYCFVASVSEAQSSMPQEIMVASSTSSSITIDILNSGQGWPAGSFSLDPGTLRGGAIAAVYVFVVCLSLLLFNGQAGSPRTRPQSVGVLTFRTLGTENDRHGAGIRDTLRAKLGSLEDIAVRPSGQELPESDTLAAGRRMNVDVVLAGSIQQERGRIRVAIELIDVRSERVVWGKTFDDEATNLFELQDSIAAEVVKRLRIVRRSASPARPSPPAARGPKIFPA